MRVSLLLLFRQLLSSVLSATVQFPEQQTFFSREFLLAGFDCRGTVCQMTHTFTGDPSRPLFCHTSIYEKSPKLLNFSGRKMNLIYNHLVLNILCSPIPSVQHIIQSLDFIVLRCVYSRSTFRCKYMQKPRAKQIYLLCRGVNSICGVSQI